MTNYPWRKASMFRFNIPSLASVKKLVQKNGQTSPNVEIEPPRAPVTRIENPWQDDLEKLVTDTLKRKDVRLEHDQVVQTGLPIDQLMEEEKKETTAEPAPIKRTMDGTVTDVKVWWGDALAPWTDHKGKGRLENADSKAHKRWFR
jgi:hypothetical protein